MIGVLASAFLIAGGSALVGQAALALCGEEQWRGYAPAIGFALLIALAAVAIRLPGRDVTAAIVCTALALVAAALIARRVSWRPGRVLIAASVVVFAMAAIPFLVNGRVGLLGVGFNNDTANHLMWTLSLAGGDGNPVPLPGTGYPLGPHALVGAVSAGLGAEPSLVFVGLLIATALMTAWTALAAADGLSRPRSALLGVLVAMPYLLAAYYSQAAFKETAQALLVLAFTLLLRDLWREPRRRTARGLLLGVLAAGAALNYGHPGLIWLVAIPIAWALLHLLVGGPLRRAALRERAGQLRRAVRPALPVIGLALAALALLVVAELPRLGQFVSTISFSPSASGAISNANVGNLAGALSPYEAFGLWPAEDFRSTSDPVLLRELGAIALGVALGGALWWRRRGDLTLPAAAAACFAIYLLSRARGESDYVSAKALVILSPVAMLTGAKALLSIASGSARRVGSAARYALAGVFVAVALASSALALRGAAVDPREHGGELRSLRSLLDGQTVLFLGQDDFARAELEGALVTDVHYPRRIPLRADRGKPFGPGQPLDFDSLDAASLDRFRYVITTAAAYQSEAPANFKLVRATPAYRVWERRGPTASRRVLGERAAPGAVLDCRTPAGRALSARAGRARVRARPIASADQPGVEGGHRRSVPLRLPRGSWELSLQYVSSQPVRVRPGDRRLPANLDLPGPYWPAGRVEGGRDRIELDLDAPSALAPGSQRAELGRLVAVRAGARPALVPLSRACGRYVDWYTLGRKRPPLPRPTR